MKNTNNDLKAMRSARSGAVGYNTVANAMPASRDAAPYLGQAHAGGSYTQDDVVRYMAASKGCQFGEEEIKRVLNAVGNYLLDRMSEEPCTYDLGFARVRPAIGGPFPSKDAAFDPERNRVYVSVTPSDAIRDAIAGTSPVRNGGESGGKPKIGNVTWDDDTSQEVKSGEPFTIFGNALTLGVGDESAELRLPDDAGTVEVTLSSYAEGNWQRLEGRLARAVEACEGAVLAVKTHGYNPNSGLTVVKSHPLAVQPSESPVVPAPTITAAGTVGDEPGVVNVSGATLQVKGTNLESVTQVQLLTLPAGEVWQTVDVEWDSEGERLIAELDLESPPTSSGAISITTAGGNATFEVTYESH